MPEFTSSILSKYCTAKLLVNVYYHNLAQLLKYSTQQGITINLPVFSKPYNFTG
jgi:3-methyladenine DNA glycosylase AlkC